MLKRNPYLVFLLLAVCVNADAQTKSNALVCSNSIIGESIELSEHRRGKNAQYNSDGIDLTTRDPNLEYFIETFIPRGLPIIPAEESSDVVVGKVVKIQPYFSEDKSQIYTEITLQPEEVLKNQSSNLLSENKTITLDIIGGGILLNSGKVVRYEVQIDGTGNPCVGNRYLFFIKKSGNGDGFYFIKGYELREGKVFTLDNSKKKLISEKHAVSEEFADEKTFLKLVRREIEKNKVK